MPFATSSGTRIYWKLEGAEGKPYGVDGQFALIDFDFSLVKERQHVPASDVERAVENDLLNRGDTKRTTAEVGNALVKALG